MSDNYEISDMLDGYTLIKTSEFVVTSGEGNENYFETDKGRIIPGSYAVVIQVRKGEVQVQFASGIPRQNHTTIAAPVVSVGHTKIVKQLVPQVDFVLIAANGGAAGATSSGTVSLFGK